MTFAFGAVCSQARFVLGPPTLLFPALISLRPVSRETVARNQAPDPYDAYTLVAILRKWVSMSIPCCSGRAEE